MGKISQGILGGVSGTVGTVVGASWKGINYLRIKSSHYKDAQTEGQVTQRTKFGACIEIAQSVMDALIKPIWNKKAVKMSGYNLFVKTNLPAFSATGEITDFSLLKFAVGDLPQASNVVIEDDAAVPGGIHLTWADNSGTGIAAATDRLRIVAMCEGEIVVLSGIAATRADQAANVLLPFGAGVSAHVYAFFENEGNTKYSTDQHALVEVS